MEKIVVTVKHVAHLSEDAEIVNNEIREDYLDYTISECDEYALEAGLQYGEKHNAEVITLTMAPFHATDTIRTCLAKGAERALRIWDDSLKNADALAKGKVLAFAIKSLAPDIIFTGAESEDDQYGSTGAVISSILGLPFLNRVIEIEEVNDGNLKVHRELEGSLREVLRINAPAVLATQPGIAEPRYAAVSAIRSVDRDNWSSLDLRELELEPEDIKSSGELINMEIIKAEKAEILNREKTTKEATRELADMLKNRG